MSTTKEKSLKDEQINITEIACNRFKAIAKNIKVPKLKYLHRSLNFKSNIYFQENEGKIYKYQKYKRGSIVMVNFGTNIGYELSGNHFAIVLNKDDNNKNGLVTVVPLTSKRKKQYLELNDSILDLVLNAQNVYLEMLLETQKLHNKHNEEIAQAQYIIEENLEKIKNILGKEEDNISIYQDLLIKMFDENDKYIEKLKELDEITKRESDEIEANMEKVFQVLDKYTSKNKTSFAMVRNITTISKLKILKPINKFDPIGNMYISDDALTRIDNEVKKIFTFSKD